MVRTTLIKPGSYEVPTEGPFRLKVVTPARSGKPWAIYKQDKRVVTRHKVIKWELVEGDFKSKGSATEYAVELDEANVRRYNPNADLLNNIDDGIDLNNEREDF